MARIRSVKPAFFRSLTITSLPISTRLTFIGLWTYADDAGRGLDDARLIKAELWPLDDKYSASKVKSDIKLLADAKLICRYKVGAREYFQITAWEEHQKINRPQESSLPTQGTITERSVNDHGTISEPSREEGNKEGKGIRNTPRERSVPPSSAFEVGFTEVWALYPRKVEKAKALKAYTARRKDGAQQSDLLAATRNYAEATQGTELTFVKHGATFFGPNKPYADWVSGNPEASANGSGVQHPRVTW